MTITNPSFFNEERIIKKQNVISKQKNEFCLLTKISYIKYELSVKYIATSPSARPKKNCKFSIYNINIKNNKWYLTLNILIDRISGGKNINKKATLGKILFQPPTRVVSEAANAGAITG